MDKDQTVKIICYGLAGLIVIYVIFEALPYIFLFLVIYGGWRLYQECQGSKRHHHDHHCHRRCNRRWRG